MTYVPLTGRPNYPGVIGINDDTDTVDLASHVALVTGTHGLGSTWFSKYLIRGRTRSGITTGEASWFAEDFADISRWQQIGGVAPLAAVTTLTGGVGEIAAGLGDNVSYAFGSLAYGSPSLVYGNGQWYMAFRMKLQAAPPADAMAAFAFESVPGDMIRCGYVPATSVGFFSTYQLAAGGGPTGLVSTIAIDDHWHDIEYWSDGSSYYLSVDAETPVHAVFAGPPLAALYNRLINNAGAAAGMTTQFDKYLIVFPQAA